MRAVKIAAFAAFLSGLVMAQSAAPPLAFEVADVQVSKPGGTPKGDFLPGGKLVLHFLTMKEMVVAAWDLDRWAERVTGGPEWLNSEHYDIVAKAAPTTPEKDLRMMLRNLLVERFKLTTHIEQKPLPVYALVVGKKGPKLREAPADAPEKEDCKIETPQERKDGMPIRSFICKQTSMDVLAKLLPQIAPAFVDLPVVNLTELKGRYDFTLGWTPRRGPRSAVGDGKAGDAPVAADPEGLTVFDALQNQLGLKLESRKQPLNIVVIDKVERTPAEI